MKKSIIIVVLTLLLIIGFSYNYFSESIDIGVERNSYTIHEIDYIERPYNSPEHQSLEVWYDVDENDYPLFYWSRDQESYYHPVAIAQKAIVWLDGYVQTGNTEYLERAERYTRKVYDESIERDGVLLFPYVFDFPLHGIEAALMEAPWYSAMAQGQVLTLFTRLYDATGEEAYLEKAEKTFRSLRVPEEMLLEDWVVIVDEENYLWLEEYPLDHLPNHGSQALNGFIFAIYGLYDYYLTTEDPEAKQILQASITTIERYIEDFRAPGEISYYSLAHFVQSGRYHMIHIDQLYMLYEITGEEYFKEMAEAFEEDYIGEH